MIRAASKQHARSIKGGAGYSLMRRASWLPQNGLSVALKTLGKYLLVDTELKVDSAVYNLRNVWFEGTPVASPPAGERVS
jgi:hypothetical protein